MVAVKKLNPMATRGKQDQKMTRSGRVSSFKIYAEVDKVKRFESLQGNGASGLLKETDIKTSASDLEKRKSNASAKPNVGRKVLADISNVKETTFGQTDSRKIFLARKGKDLHIQKYAKASGNSGSSSLDKREGGNKSVKLPINLHKAGVDRTQPMAENKNMQKVANSEKPKTKFQGRQSTNGTAVGMKSVVKPLPLTRKSMPVLKQVNRTNRFEKPESLEKSERISGKHGLPVKPTVRTSIVPKASSKLNSRLLEKRVSDGFLLRASRSQAKPNNKVLPRKSLKHITRDGSGTTVFNARRNSKLNQTLAKKKLSSYGCDLSKHIQNKSSLRKEVATDTSQQKSEETNSNVSGDATETQTRIVSSRKSGRRSSFTSALISRSKFPKECSKVSLPDIYDSLNHLEVSDYVDDIYQYYWVMEARNPLLENYLEIQKDITPQMRGILINWLIEVHMKFDLMDETLFLTITLLDRYLSLVNIKKNEMQLVGITALMLASKYEDFWHPRVADLIGISAESYSRDQVLNMEKNMLKKLKFRLNQPTLYVFMLRFIRAAQADMKFEHLAFYLVELSLVQYEALKYNPSMLCASAIYVARCTMNIAPPWTPLLAKHTRYEESQIRDCAEMMLKFHKEAKTAILRVTHEKYAKTRYSKVASLKPLRLLEKSKI